MEKCSNNEKHQLQPNQQTKIVNQAIKHTGRKAVINGNGELQTNIL